MNLMMMAAAVRWMISTNMSLPVMKYLIMKKARSTDSSDGLNYSGRNRFRDYHHYRQCPIEGCMSVVKRMPPHLRNHHKITSTSEIKHLLSLIRSNDNQKKLIKFHQHEIDGLVDAINDTITLKLVADRALKKLGQAGDIPCEEHAASSFPRKNINCEIPTCDGEDEIIFSIEGDECDMESSESFDDQNINACEILTPSDTQDTQIYREFQKWLESADGSKKAQKTAKQHSCQVMTIAATIDGLNRPASLLNKQLLTDKFLEEFVKAKKFKAGTTKSYLGSLCHWYRFLISEKLHDFSDSEITLAQEMLPRVGRWIAAFRKEGLKRSLEKADSDLTRLITPEQVNIFERSVPALKAVKLIGSAVSEGGKGHSLVPGDHVIIRDFLLTEITLCNANRSGVLSMMTVDELHKARKVDN